MNSVTALLSRIYKQRINDFIETIKHGMPLRYRAALTVLVALTALSFMFVFFRVQASRASQSNTQAVSPTPTIIPTIVSGTVTPTSLIPSPKTTSSITPTKASSSPTPTVTPSRNNIATATTTPTPSTKPGASPTPTSKVQPTNSPIPRPPTSTPIPTATATPEPTQSSTEETPFSFSLSPQGSFTPNAQGQGSGTITKPSGFWNFTFSANFTKLIPGRTYQLWLCGTNCSSHTSTQFTADGQGNGSFSNVLITHHQAKDPINRIAVWEASVPGIIQDDATACVMLSINAAPCLQTTFNP